MIKQFWDSLSKHEQSELAGKIGYSHEYLRLVFSGHKKAGFILAQRLEEETSGAISKTELRPDIYPIPRTME